MTLLDLVPPEPWTEEALCAQTDPELFYPEKGGSVEQAKRICSHCPVIDECRAYALTHREPQGVWGGLSPQERRPLYEIPRQQAPIQHGTESGYQTHRRRKEAACVSCRDAAAAAARQRTGSAA